jgi:V-type H+-transporting ATPase subunit a
MIMMLALFGWMDFLIIMKWLHPWKLGWENDTNEAPSIISTMISMFLNFGQIQEGTIPLIDHQVFWSNNLLMISLITVPWMLLLKPLVLKSELDKEHLKELRVKALRDKESKEKEGRELLSKSEIKRQEKMQDLMNFVKDKGEKEHNFSEIFIHQLIETIEFALGTVSNTASYL